MCLYKFLTDWCRKSGTVREAAGRPRDQDTNTGGAKEFRLEPKTNSTKMLPGGDIPDQRLMNGIERTGVPATSGGSAVVASATRSTVTVAPEGTGAAM